MEKLLQNLGTTSIRTEQSLVFMTFFWCGTALIKIGETLQTAVVLDFRKKQGKSLVSSQMEEADGQKTETENLIEKEKNNCKKQKLERTDMCL